MRSFKVAQKRLTKSNDTPAMDLGLINVGLKCYSSYSNTQIYNKRGIEQNTNTQ